MSGLLIIGTIVGSILGIFHGWGVYAGRVREAMTETGVPARTRLRAAYCAAWTAVLWTAFGSYVLVLWLIAVPLWCASRVVSSSPAASGA